MKNRSSDSNRSVRRPWFHWVPLPFSQKLLLLLLIAVVTPMVASMLVFDSIMQTYQSDRSHYDGASLGGVLATNLAGHIDTGWTRADRVLMDYLATDDSIAFMCVADAQGRPIHMSVHDAQAWDAYAESQRSTLNQGHFDFSKRVAVGTINDIVIRTVPIFAEGEASAGTLNATSEPEGYVVLGIHDVSFAAASTQYQFAQMVIAGGVLLSLIPMILWAYARWTRPLRWLRAGVLKLADGQPPVPMFAREQDDIGRLVGAFNRMTGTVLAAQRQLRDTNINLEGIVQQRTIELREAVRELEQLSTTDVLTGLSNRRAFYRNMENDYARSAGYNSELSVLMIDLDGFKQVNDTLGHDVGDEILVAAAEAVISCCDTNMTPARLGGDEFVILVRHLPEEECRDISKAISQAFRELVDARLARFKSHPKVTMSLGLAMLRATKADSGEVLVAMADMALYRAKSLGRSQLCVFDASMASGRSHNVREETAGHMEAA